MKHATYTDTQQAIANEINKCEKVIASLRLASLGLDDAPAELIEARKEGMKYYEVRLAQLRKETHDLRIEYYGEPDELMRYRLGLRSRDA